MIAAVDVDYRDDHAVAACITFGGWGDERAASERVVPVTGVAPYEPGAVYKRELPPLLKVLDGVDADVVVVDGYVWLAGGKRGLGAHLHEALNKPVIGVAKTHFHGADAIAVTRGGSSKPLYVAAAGIDTARAAADVQRMHGPHRIPTLLQRVDRLCREG